MQRKNSVEIMASDETFAADFPAAADAYNMLIMQTFRAEIPDFINQLDEYKGRMAEEIKSENPELSDFISNYEFKPKDVVNIFNDYISNSFDEMKELAAEETESTEIINEFNE